jgi:uncharacterized metal-binding protein YceD (DUF177 family)
VWQDLDVEFVKLKDGLHEFGCLLEKPFFEAFDNSDVLEASVQTDITLEKLPNLMHVSLHMKGYVSTSCDRCLEAVKLPIDTTYRLIYKQLVEGERQTESDSLELIYLGTQEFRLNLALPVYETILLDVPMLRNCDELEEKPCNQEMLKKLNELNNSDSEVSDPRWDKLKDLIKK